ncbi:MAG: hypothetical protein JEZ06_00480 [Anaerolineaceae bacterium]|nr:hypothetical protein [Anaerolineaceae bacterium]
MQRKSFGTILAYGDGETVEEFTKLGQLKDLDGPDMQRGVIDVTHHQSPNGYVEKLPDLKDGGVVNFDIELDPALATHDQTTGFMAKFEETGLTNFRLVFPVAAVIGYWGIAFAGFVKAFKPKAGVKGSLQASVSIEVSGKPVLQDIDISGFYD